MQIKLHYLNMKTVLILNINTHLEIIKPSALWLIRGDACLTSISGRIRKTSKIYPFFCVGDEGPDLFLTYQPIRGKNLACVVSHKTNRFYKKNPFYLRCKELFRPWPVFLPVLKAYTFFQSMKHYNVL